MVLAQHTVKVSLTLTFSYIMVYSKLFNKRLLLQRLIIVEEEL